MSGRVPRFAKVAEHVRRPQAPRVDQCHDPELGVGDDGAAADGLDAARVGEGPNRPADATGPDVDDHETSLEIGGDERERCA
jgi:hypothetical protein